MAKNVLILSSSLRKGGNSDLLCDEFVKGVRESGHNAEKIFLKDKSINYCTGCGYCFERIGNCSQKDDIDRKSTRLNSSHNNQSRMPSSA